MWIITKDEKKTSKHHKKIPAFTGMRGWVGMRERVEKQCPIPTKMEWFETIPHISYTNPLGDTASYA